MKASVLTGIRRMEMRDLPMPVLERPGDVLLRVTAVGVCGSDVHYYTTGRIGSQVVQYPFRVGHEMAGEVVEIGHDVRRVKVGQRVAVDPAEPCGRCDQCAAGRRHTCRSLKFLGCPGQSEGCLCEYVVMPEESCFPVAKRVTAAQAAIVEPLSIAVYASEFAMPLEDARVGILGNGPIGLSVLLAARNAGVAAAYVTDRVAERLAAAQDQGATWSGNPDTTDVVSEIAAREPLLLDAVFECCGQQSAMDQAVRLLKPGGILVLVGIPEVDRVSFDIDGLRRKELRLQNVRRQNECVQTAVDMIENGAVNVDFMVTHRFTPERTQEAFDLVADYRDGVIKAMIEW